MSENTHSDIIYLEAESEITEAIDKLKASSASEVRISVPARSTLLQSAINLKLLKRAAGSKNLILVSTDKATMSLAAGLGLAVAKNVKASAEIPELATAPIKDTGEPVVIEQQDAAGAANEEGVKTSTSKSGNFEKKHISFKNDKSSSMGKKAKKDKAKLEDGEPGPKVPNFMGLNKKIAIFGSLMLLLGLLAAAYIFLPTAKVTLTAKAVATPVNVSFTLDSETTKTNAAEGLVAADLLTSTKDLEAQYQATGKKEVGTKAEGSIAVRNCDDTNTHNLPAGSVVSTAGKTFTTGATIVIPAGSSGGGVVNCSSAVNVNITASAPGDSYNVSSASFNLAGFSSLYKATGSTSGGSSKTVSVVTAADIQKAQDELIEGAKAQAKEDLQEKVGDDQIAFEQTFQSEVSNVSASAPADSENTSGTLKARVKYSMLTAREADIDTIFRDQISTQIPGGNEIYQSGVDSAKYELVKLDGGTKAQMKATGEAFYGETIDKDQVARDIAGKSKKDAFDAIKPKYSQVESIAVESNPALMPNLPFFGSRITIEIKVSTN